MKAITDYVLALAALVEAEGRLLRRQVGRTAVAVVLLGVVGLLSLLGLGLVAAGGYHWLASIWGVAAAFAIVGLGCLTVALVLAYWAYRWIR